MFQSIGYMYGGECADRMYRAFTRFVVVGDCFHHAIWHTPKPQRVGAYLGVSGSKDFLLHEPDRLAARLRVGYRLVIFLGKSVCEHELADIVKKSGHK